MKLKTLLLIPLIASVISCGSGGSKIKPVQQDTEKRMVKIMTVDPGHFHAALVQKIMYDQISPDVNVYAPEGPDVKQHLGRITHTIPARLIRPNGMKLFIPVLISSRRCFPISQATWWFFRVITKRKQSIFQNQ